MDDRDAHNFKTLASIALTAYVLYFFVAVAIELGLNAISDFLFLCIPLIAVLMWWFFDLKKKLVISDRKKGPDAWIDYFKK